MRQSTQLVCLWLWLSGAPLGAVLEHQQSAGAKSRQDPSDETLYDRARRAGGHYQEVLREDAVPPASTIRDLAARSPDIVIGQVLARRGHLTEDQRMVRTDVVLKVQQTVRGGSRPGQLITIAVPGGSYRFPDGTKAALYREYYRPIRDKERYLFFLQRSLARLVVRGDIAYELAAGPQGQFEAELCRRQGDPCGDGKRSPDPASLRANEHQGAAD